MRRPGLSFGGFGDGGAFSSLEQQQVGPTGGDIPVLDLGVASVGSDDEARAQTDVVDETRSLQTHHETQRAMGKKGAATVARASGRRRRESFYAEYIKVRQIGQGGTAMIFEAVKRTSGEHFAIKQVDLKRDGMTEENSRREIEVLRALVGVPNTIQLQDAVRLPHRICIILEICLGGELFSAITACGMRGLPEVAAAHITRQVIGAVAHCHDLGFSHGDIKPENILFKSPWDAAAPDAAERAREIDVRLVDFELSQTFFFQPTKRSASEPSLYALAASTPLSTPEKSTPSSTTTLSPSDDRAASRSVSPARHRRGNSGSGTPGYMSPQLVRGGVGTEADDAWAIGVVVHAMLCGCMPLFTTPSAAEREEERAARRSERSSARLSARSAAKTQSDVDRASAAAESAAESAAEGGGGSSCSAGEINGSEPASPLRAISPALLPAEGELILFTVTFCANPAHHLTCSPSYVFEKNFCMK